MTKAAIGIPWGIAIGLLAVELDGWRFRLTRWLHPQTGFPGAMLLVLLLFATQYVAFAIGIEPPTGLIAMVAGSAVWALWPVIRKRLFGPRAR